MSKENQNLKQRLIQSLDLFLELGFAITPVLGNKAPYRNNWQHESPLSKSDLIREIRSGRCKGLGIRTGPISRDIVAVDLDGPSAHPKMLELSGGKELPKTVAFTSGRPGRRQYLFQVPEQYREAIQTKKFKTGVKSDDGKLEQVELRWDGCQSVLPPSQHPTTGQYHWVEGCAIWECEIAVCPLWLIKLMLLDHSVAQQQTLPNQTEIYTHQNHWTSTDWALSYLNALAPTRADDYDEWLAVGMALHSVDDSLLIEWDRWSQESSKYKAGECDKKWKSFKRSGLSIGSLAHMAKQDGWRSPFSLQQHFIGDGGHSSFLSSVNGEQRDRGTQRQKSKEETNYMNLKSPALSSSPASAVSLEQRIDEILDRNLPNSEQETEFLHLAASYRRSKREILDIVQKRIIERDLEDYRDERLQELEELEKLERVKLDLEDFLHPNLAKPIKHLAQLRKLRPEYFLAGLLPIVASLVGTKASLQIAPDYVIPSVLNVGVVGEASDKKSPVISALMNPLKRLQGELIEHYQAQKAEYEKAVKQWESLPKNVRSSKPREDEFVTTGDKTLFITEYSREGICKTHALNPNGMLIYKSELVGVYKSFNQYRSGRGDDEEFFNALWDGDMIKRTLASKDIYIPQTAVSQLGGTQPDVLLRLMGDMNDANGRWARYLWVLAPLERRFLDLSPIPDINDLLYGIYRQLYFDLPKKVYTLSPEAETLYLDWHNRLEEKQFSTLQQGLRAVYGKAQGQTNRIALTLHCINAAIAGEVPAPQVSANTMVAAIKLMKFFLGQLTLIRAQGQASITRDSGRPAVYQQIKKLCQRLESKAEILTARMVLSARLPVFEGVKAADIVTVFKDMALMGKGILAKAKRSLGLVIDSVIDDGSGGSDGASPDPGGGTNDCGFHGGSPLPDQNTPIQVAQKVDHIELETAETAGNCWEDKQQLESNNRKAYSSSTKVLSLPFNRHSSFLANIKMKMNGGQGLKGVSSGKTDETQNSIFRPERQAGWC